MAKLVTYDQFDANKVLGSEPIPKEINKPNETIKYNDIKLSYNYGTDQEPIIQDLYVEGCEVTATGIKTREEPATGKNGPYTKVSSSMMLVFDLSDIETRAETELCLNKLDEVHSAASHCIGACKGKLRMHDFDASKPGLSFKNPVYWHRDEVSGERVKGKNPNLWVKLKPYKNNRTLFTDLNGNIIDWKLLQDVEITMVPCWHFEKIYVGSKASLQVHLASAVILKIVAAGTESRQTSTLDRLKSKYADLQDQVEAQLADLRMTRQEHLNDIPVPSSHTEFGSDYASESPSMHNMNEHTEESASIHDFLSGAPTMNATSQVSLPQVQTLPTQTAPRLNIQPTNSN